jgi:hypothetical protein
MAKAKDFISRHFGKSPLGNVIHYITTGYDAYEFSTEQFHELIAYLGELARAADSRKVDGCLDLSDPVVAQKWAAKETDVLVRLTPQERLKHLDR